MNAEDFVGFAPPSVRFDLAAELQRARSAEIARIAAIAERLSQRFGAVIAVGFLCCEILGRHAAAAECADLVSRLEREPAAASNIASELLALARSERGYPARPS